METVDSLTGKMLIAMPGIGDPRFERSLLYICAHDREHAMALCVNNPVESLTIRDLLRRLDVGTEDSASTDLVLIGGPVEHERGFVLHSDDYAASDGATLSIIDGLALTASREALEVLSGKRTPPRRSALALGYAGWGEGQLEREIRRNVWLTCDADEDLIFETDHAGKWSKALAGLGIDPRLLSAETGEA
ncbi:MAG: hypothetical protein CFE28_03650 [Alphaproteobacteria bacterium PA2]|nr:MAG: hypothetical protein CFE28_03650 [Alphaproteobacteria bacterium PA2]